MKKKRFIVVMIIVLAIAGAAIAFGLPAIDRVEKLRLAGELEKAKQEAIANGQEYVVARGKNIEITNPEVDRIVSGYALLNSTGTREDAIAFLAKRAALEAEAIERGYTITDQEVQDYINLQLEMSKNASNYEEFAAFLEGASMTAEEYWQSQYDILRQELLYGPMLQDMRAAWAKEPSLRSVSQEELAKQLNDRVEAFKEELLEAEDLVIVE